MKRTTKYRSNCALGRVLLLATLLCLLGALVPTAARTEENPYSISFSVSGLPVTTLPLTFQNNKAVGSYSSPTGQWSGSWAIDAMTGNNATALFTGKVTFRSESNVKREFLAQVLAPALNPISSEKLNFETALVRRTGDSAATFSKDSETPMVHGIVDGSLVTFNSPLKLFRAFIGLNQIMGSNSQSFDTLEFDLITETASPVIQNSVGFQGRLWIEGNGAEADISVTLKGKPTNPSPTPIPWPTPDPIATIDPSNPPSLPATSLSVRRVTTDEAKVVISTGEGAASFNASVVLHTRAGSCDLAELSLVPSSGTRLRIAAPEVAFWVELRNGGQLIQKTARIKPAMKPAKTKRNPRCKIYRISNLG